MYPSRCDPVQSHGGVPLEKHACRVIFELRQRVLRHESGDPRCVHTHLAPRGTCLLNVFHPQGGFEGVQQEWVTATEGCRWEGTVDGVRLRCDERRLHLAPERPILYPELVYRRYVGGVWIEDAVLKIPRRCYAPDAFEQVILEHGFRIVQHWGGYAGERYGEGPELVVQFGA